MGSRGGLRTVAHGGVPPLERINGKTPLAYPGKSGVRDSAGGVTVGAFYGGTHQVKGQTMEKHYTYRTLPESRQFWLDTAEFYAQQAWLGSIVAMHCARKAAQMAQVRICQAD